VAAPKYTIVVEFVEDRVIRYTPKDEQSIFIRVEIEDER
jgi:hypothetical protein